MAKFRLLTNAFIDGQLYRSTSIIEKPDNWEGPVRPIRQPIGGRPDFDRHQEKPLFRRVDDETH
jgi:hypothetical protein